jgi:hypothetical protein
MDVDEMAHANWRLDNPPVVDVAVSRRMGLFVVARLASRHGIRVRLRPASMGGLTALVWLPDEVIMREAFPSTLGFRRFQAPGNGTVTAPDGPAGEEPGDRSAAARAVAAARTARFDPAPDPDEAPTDPGSFPDDGQLAAAPTAEVIAPGPLADSVLDYAPDDGHGTDGHGADGHGAIDYGSLGSYTVLGTNGGPAVNRGPGTSGGPGTNGSSGVNGAAPATDGEAMMTPQGVVVPPPAAAGEENRLPIFESVESDWFRRGRHGTNWTATVASTAAATPPAASGWSSPADAGWQAAEVAHAPVTSGTTRAGLPKRVPKANLVPGGVATQTAAVPAPRSAAQTRQRLSSFQQGVRDARAAAPADDDQQRDDQGREDTA